MHLSIVGLSVTKNDPLSLNQPAAMLSLTATIKCIASLVRTASIPHDSALGFTLLVLLIILERDTFRYTAFTYSDFPYRMNAESRSLIIAHISSRRSLVHNRSQTGY